jgi:membrane fusion protein (multidrug efflux system)
VSLQSAQRADADFKQAQANGHKARAVLVAAQRELDVIASRRQQARSRAGPGQAERDLAQLNLAYTEVRAPIDGTVGNRRARAGAYAQSGEQLMALVPARGLWIDANFKESQLARLQPGQRVEVEADVLPGRVFHGRVQTWRRPPAPSSACCRRRTRPAISPRSSSACRCASCSTADGALGRLRPGLSVTAVVDARYGGNQGGQRVAANQP